jgi:hypothetical protein
MGVRRPARRASVEDVQLAIRYFDGCPHWEVARERLDQALRVLGRSDQPVELERVESEEDAQRLWFRGSPTIIIDGVDPFSAGDSPVGLSCRVYMTETGLEGAPSLEQLLRVLGGPSPAVSRGAEG